MSRIVLIEDDEGIGETLRFNLEAAGHQILVARDGVSGLRLARTGAPNLVLLDLVLPGMHGIDVCRQLRRSWVSPDHHAHRAATPRWTACSDWSWARTTTSRSRSRSAK
jgi:CheY-like chemotaxis protein